ncbi:hypothetical protein DFQ27_000812 [Actinomortierella ambigua]|uniref:Retrotransposon gag domain-containing protein n=1 Tax=Actinomortierella ambigua TaxID=1343610 RepID=A0A9P6TW65_9FUNG|nr:hypothetical protein DFQ27_000812 [Actinomortierella ambigua]
MDKLVQALHPITKDRVEEVKDKVRERLPTFPFVQKTKTTTAGPSRKAAKESDEAAEQSDEGWVDGGQPPEEWIETADLVTMSIPDSARIMLVVNRLNTSSLVWANDWLQRVGAEFDDWNEFRDAFLEEHEVRRTAFSALTIIQAKPQRSPGEYARQYKERCQREFRMVPWDKYDQEGVVLPESAEKYIIHQLRANMEPEHPVRLKEGVDTWKKFIEEIETVSKKSAVPGNPTLEERKLRKRMPLHGQPAAKEIRWGGEKSAVTPTNPRAGTKAPRRGRTMTLGDLEITEDEYDQFVEAVGADGVAQVVCEDDGVEQLCELFQRFTLLARHQSPADCALAMPRETGRDLGPRVAPGRDRLPRPSDSNPNNPSSSSDSSNSNSSQRRGTDVFPAVAQNILADIVQIRVVTSAARRDIMHGTVKV